jgi:hypothetical protein
MGSGGCSASGASVCCMSRRRWTSARAIRVVPAARRAREYERLIAAPHGASERPVAAGLRDALEWYRAHRWPVLVSTGMHGIAGGVIELGEGHAVLRNQSSTVNVPLRRVRRVRPWWEQTPGDAPVWEAAAASSGGGSG